MSTAVHLRWYCGCFTAPPTWGGEDGPECAAEWETEEDTEEWAEGHCSSECPSCGQSASQRMDQGTLLS